MSALDNLREGESAFLAEHTAAGMRPEGFVAVMVFMDEDGQECWRVVDRMDATLASIIGFMEMAKVELLARQLSAVPSLAEAVYGDDEDDEG